MVLMSGEKYNSKPVDFHNGRYSRAPVLRMRTNAENKILTV
jgi:hypothetical protein